jgi:hypothetical protein
MLNPVVAQVEQFLLDCVQPVRGDPRGWKHGPSLIFRYADEDVAASEIMEVVGEAQTVCRTASGFQPSLNSSRSHSTRRPLRISSRLIGKLIKAADYISSK